MAKKDDRTGSLPAGNGGSSQRLDDVLLHYVDRLNSGETLDRAKVLAEQPELGPELLERLETFVELDPLEAEGTPLRTLGDYRIGRRIGRGGMGIVHVAWQVSLERQVALKILPPGIAADPRTVTRFVREAQVSAKLQHPHIVPVFGMGVEGGTPYYAMELVEGETLAQLLAREAGAAAGAKGPFGTPRDDPELYLRAAQAFADVADGLQHAHAKGVVHRDIKPSNLILDREGRLRILDFGLARLEGQESLTLSGDFLGTPLYMSPEQARARRVPIDHRTDIYSLGATLYEVLGGEPPFRGKDHRETLSQIIDRDARSPRVLNARIPKDLETVVLKCLAKEPADRYGTAEALAQDLRRFARGDPIEARPESVLGRLARKTSRNKGRLAIAAILAILLAATGILLWRSHREAEMRKSADYESTVRGAVVKLQGRQPAMQVKAGRGMRVKPILIDWRIDFKTEGARGSADPAEQALADLEAAGLSIPGRPDAHFQRARGLLLLGREGEAKGSLLQAIHADPGFAPARVLYSSMLEKEKDREGARREMEAVEKSGQAGWAQVWLSAHRATEGGRWEEAAAAYGKLLDMERAAREPYLGSSIDLRLARGNSRLEVKDFSGAIEDFVAARMLSPRSTEPGLLLGMAYFLKGEEDQAERTFEEVLAQAKLESSAQTADKVALGIVGIYHYQRRRDKALWWVDRVAEADLRESIRAGILPRLGRQVEAEAAARRAIRLNPRNTRAYAFLAWSLERQQRLEEGERAARAGLAINPNDWRLHFFLAGNLEMRGELERAIEETREAIKLDDSNGYMFSCLGRLYRQKGDFEQAFEWFRRGIEAVPQEPWAHSGLGDTLLTLGKFQEALAEYRKALEIDPWDGAGNIATILERGENSDLGPEILRLLDLLEKLFSDKRSLPRDLSGLFQSSIHALLTRHGADRLDQALRRSRRTAEATSRREPEILASLAEAEFENGLRAEAVLTLEEALSLPHAARSLAEALERYRKAVLPDLASHASIDAAISSVEVDRREEVLEAFRVTARGPTAASRVGYFEARLLEEAGRHEEAVEKFKGLEGGGDGRLKPILHAAACLRSAGKDRDSEAALREILERSGFGESEAVWRLWAEIGFVDLHRLPSEMLTDMPAKAGGYGADVRWLLERLASREGIRIDCGGEGYRDREGKEWSRDRFFSSGYANFEERARSDHYSDEIAATQDDLLYQTVRWFPAEEIRPAGYSIPLPPAAYRVTLHFVEWTFTEGKKRSFDVLLEGKEFLGDYEPLAKGFATADSKSFDITVTDGCLGIEFQARNDNPQIAAIEIERIE